MKSSLYCYSHRYPVAIKHPLNDEYEQTQSILEEAKSMVQLNGYHRHIVNLQGIVYARDDQDDQSAKVLSTTISV